MGSPWETGIITIDYLKKYGLFPPEDRLKKGPVVIIECIEEIPCNICVDACPNKAISKETLTAIPKVDFNKCVGCGRCVMICPGLAIFVIDISRDDDKAYITLPYEFLPRPNIGDYVDLLNREGKVVGKGRVVNIMEDNKTLAVTVEVPRDFVWDVRAIKVVKHEGERKK